MVELGERCPTRTRRLLLAAAVYGLALAVRLTVYVQASHWPTFTHPQIDEFTAHQIGLAFLHGQTPAEVYLKGPLYMYFVAAVAWLFGPDPLNVRLVQAFLSSLTPVLIFLAVDRIFGCRIALITGVLAATFWTIVYYSLAIVDAALSSLLYALLLYLLVAIDDRRWWKWPICGAVMGVGALSRPSVLAFAPLLAVIVFASTLRAAQKALHDHQPAARRWSGSGVRRAIRNVVLLTLGCLIPILPVTIRNRVVAGEWVLIGAYGGQNLWIANSPRSDGKNVPIYVGQGVPKVTPVEDDDVWTHISLGNRIARYYAEEALHRRLTFAEIDAWFAQIATQYIKTHPGESLLKSFKRFCFFLNAYEYPNDGDLYWFCETSRLLEALSYLHYGIICPLALIGLAYVIASRPWPAGMAYLIGFLVALWFPGLFFVINARFRVVVVWLMLPFAAYGLVRLISLCKRGVPWSARALPFTSLAALAVLSNVNLFGYREPYYTDQRMAFVVACTQAGRDDLMPRAMQRFEEAMVNDLPTGKYTQTAIIEYAHPIGWMFSYYHLAGQLDKALYYGALMIRREPPDARRTPAFFDVALAMDQKDDAADALRLLRAGKLGVHPLEIAIRLFRFGQKYEDPDSLARAEEILKRLTQQYPMNTGYYQMLDAVRKLIDKQSPPTTSQASTTNRT
ncbi:MAG: glycosyltransferase family 39 protein [Phycisphaerae bacterium]|nr:glycosyltransferase family 39 protein [Phycisphaerae bacterium]